MHTHVTVLHVRELAELALIDSIDPSVNGNVSANSHTNTAKARIDVLPQARLEPGIHFIALLFVFGLADCLHGGIHVFILSEKLLGYT